MLITLSAIDFDPLGYLEIKALPTSDTRSLTRRVSRVATLDGGVAVNDSGFSEGDRIVEIRMRKTRTAEEIIGRMMRLHSRLRMCAQDGVYIVAISAYRSESAESRLSILVIEKVSE